MGYETKCNVRVDDGSGNIRQATSATVLLETDDLIVRGDARVKVPRSSITKVASRGGVVTVVSPTATISLTLGAQAAAKWHKKLEEAPKQLIDKLDVKPEAKVWLSHVDDTTLIEQVAARTSNASSGRSATKCDVVFVQVNSSDDLDRIDRAAKAIVENGAIWVVHPKGVPGVADTAIFRKGKALGLTYTKVARVSATLSAEKLVWPRASRTR
jgi:dihydroorotase-like cyclic amidohydrolase